VLGALLTKISKLIEPLPALFVAVAVTLYSPAVSVPITFPEESILSPEGCPANVKDVGRFEAVTSNKGKLALKVKLE